MRGRRGAFGGLVRAKRPAKREGGVFVREGVMTTHNTRGGEGFEVLVRGR